MFETKYRLIVRLFHLRGARYVYKIEKKLWWWPWWMNECDPCFDKWGWCRLNFGSFKHAEEHGRKQLEYIVNPYTLVLNKKTKQRQQEDLELPEEVEKWLLDK